MYIHTQFYVVQRRMTSFISTTDESRLSNRVMRERDPSRIIVHQTHPPKHHGHVFPQLLSPVWLLGRQKNHTSDRHHPTEHRLPPLSRKSQVQVNLVRICDKGEERRQTYTGMERLTRFQGRVVSPRPHRMHLDS